MDFRTKVPITKSDLQISHSSEIFLMGSCFVENIGDKLEHYKFKTCQNPFGIVFHPQPILNLLERIASNSSFQQEDVRQFGERWLTLEAHSKMNADSEEKCLQKLNSALKSSRDSLENSEYVIISLGTAWFYRFLESGKVVANCHKIPQKEFSKELSTANEIEEILNKIRSTLLHINKNVKIIYTVSPVRHLKDGFVENQHSKSNLIAGLHSYLKNDNSSYYFPSYEIMLDELRDYRFYGKDMLHPNEVAIDYIWKAFSENWMSAETVKLNVEIDKIQRGLSHRSRAENSTEHKKFLTNLQAKIEEIQKTYPKITFS